MSHTTALHAASSTWVGVAALSCFVLAYLLVTLEELTKMKKSKPVLVSASFIWLGIAWYGQQQGLGAEVEAALSHNVLEYAYLLLFLLVAMTYINALEERRVFEALNSWLIKQGYSLGQLFWITGFLAFVISPFADNLTTALVMCSLLLSCVPNNSKFLCLGCINIVVAANAGGVFSPFGDITSLMVWQSGAVHFDEFFYLILPALISYLVPALFLYRALPKGQLSPPKEHRTTSIKTGGLGVVALFLLTITTAITFHNQFHLPPALGMMLGLAYLQFFGYGLYLKQQYSKHPKEDRVFDVFQKIQRAEWDTLLFFYGIMLSVGGLATLGYLDLLGQHAYGTLGQGWPEGLESTPANVLVGVLSAVVDNIPVMYAVLTIDPVMNLGGWLMVTLTAGIGGSLLSIGSAAGVALMGQSKGHYTFLSHLKWSWAIALGYILAVASHLWLNASLFEGLI